jgi:hypothetical protein
MQLSVFRTIELSSFALVVMLTAAWQLRGQDTKAPYPSMAPLDQYLMERNAEISLARSAAPASISNDADVMVLGRHGYETVVKGKNGFVCIVWRSWAAGIDDPDFWNPKLRALVCFNAPAARFNVPLTLKRTELVLAGRSKSQMFADINTAFGQVLRVYGFPPTKRSSHSTGISFIPRAAFSDFAESSGLLSSLGSPVHR